MERTNSGIMLLVVYLLLAVYLLPLYPAGHSKNELTDWATSVALVEANSFNLADLKKNTGVDFEGVVVDKDGGIYSAKAPGMAILSAPIYALTRILIGVPTRDNVWVSLYVLRIAISTLPLLLLGLWLYNRDIDSFSLATLLFATPLFSYSLLLYSHVFAAILVYMSFRLIYDSRRVMPGTCFSAAFILGVAVLCEYAAIVPAIIIGMGLLLTNRIERNRRIVFFIAGALPPIALLFVHQFFVFGSPVAFLGFTGLHYPTLDSFYQLLIGPSYGLFLFSPILILGLFSLTSSDNEGRNRFFIKITIILVTVVAISGAAERFAGASVGPRYLLLLVPFLLDSIFDGEIEEYSSYLRGSVFVISFVLCTLPMLTYPFTEAGIWFPHNSFWMPLMLSEGGFATTLANVYGFETSYRTILPAVALLLIALLLVWRDAKYPVRFAGGMLLGLSLAVVYIFAISLEPGAATKAISNAVTILGV